MQAIMASNQTSEAR